MINGQTGIRGLKILDVGCGLGGNSIKALEKGAIVTAIDISPQSIAYLNKRAKEMGVQENLYAYVMDAQNLDFEDNTFDLVIGDSILHHLPHLEKALQEILRVLKYGGYAVFEEPLGMNPFLYLYRVMTPNARTKDEWPFKMKEIRTILRVFPNSEFVYFDLATLFSKFLYAIRLDKLGHSLNSKLIAVDDKLLRSKHSKIPDLLQKMSWRFVVKMHK